MHEMALAMNLVETAKKVAAEHNAKAVKKIIVVVGELTCVDPPTFRFAFEAVSRGTIADGADLVLEQEPLIIKCSNCGYHGKPLDKTAIFCPQCQNHSVQIVSGRDILLKTVDLELD